MAGTRYDELPGSGIGSGDTTNTKPRAAEEGSSAAPEAAVRALEGRYEGLIPIGRGGMGVVFRARDRETGDTVALKVLRPEIAADPEAIERFKSELLLARRITHKNVCRIHELLRFGEVAAISMEYVEGESLSAILRRFGGVPLRRGLEWATQICSGLSEAHAQGIVHRDLKPQNILIAADGTAKVMDFGIAKSLEAATSATGVVGTPAYMSPEQASGKPADARSDIYCLGLILYEMFTGHRAFQGDTPAACIAKHLHETPRPARHVEPHLPPFLDRTIERCLRKEARDRFQTAAELAAALSEKPEAPTAPGEKPPDVSPPAHLLVWTRRDHVVAALGMAGWLAWILLLPLCYPPARTPFTASPQEVAERAGTIVRKIDQSLLLAGGLPFLSGPFGDAGPATYFAALSLHGRGIADRVADPRPGWQLGLSDKGAIGMSPDGRFEYLYLGPRPMSKEGLGPPRDEDVRATAVRYVREILGVDVSQLTPRSTFESGRTPLLRLSWSDLPGSTPETRHAVVTAWDAGGLLSIVTLPLWRLDSTQLLAEKRTTEKDRFDRSVVMRTRDEVFAAIAALMGFLFLRHRLFGTTRPMALAVSIAAGAAGLVFLGAFPILGWDTSFAYSPGDRVALAWGNRLLTGLVLSLAAYALVSVSEHYLGRTLPAALATWRGLARGPAIRTPSGMAILRGAPLGLAVLGLHAILVYVLVALRLGVPDSLIFRAQSEAVLFLTPACAAAAGTIWSAWCLVGFPAALAKRAGRRASAPVFVPGALWLLTASALPGTAAFPLLPLLLVSAVQGFAFAAILRRYDFLTLVVSIFTLETWALAYPIYEMFHRVEWLWSVAGMVPWALLILLGAATAFWPQLARAGQVAKAVLD